MMKNIIKLVSTFCLVSIFLASCAKGPKVSEGALVSLEYTGIYQDSKETFDSNVGKNPLNIVVGANQILPAFEKKITGMAEGAKKKISLKAKDAYGEVDETKVVTVPKDERFTKLNVEPGQFITANQRDANGKPVTLPVKVVKVTDKEITLDYNHPLAGKDLLYDVTVLKIQPKEEVEKIRAQAKAVKEGKAPIPGIKKQPDPSQRIN